MVSRRQFLTGALAGLAVAGCSPVIDRAAQPPLPDDLTTVSNRVWHLMNRTTFGPRPGLGAEIEAVGVTSWLDAQLDPDSVDDTRAGLRMRRYNTLDMQPQDLNAFNPGEDQAEVADELAAATLIRAVYSRRQLQEVMAGFWSDHFSIFHGKLMVIPLKTVDDRAVVREHVFGTFRDLLSASAHSPAMLTYLDNVENEQSHPNENYAREIMELHTLGVNGGYTEDDVKEVARCFTGWSVNDAGKFEFVSDWHDDGEKVVLGERIPAGGGKSDGDRVIEILAAHPNTARYVCTKLARRFVADAPPARLVEALTASWAESDGDVRALLRTMFDHPDFWSAPPKFKRPFELIVSTLRATNARIAGTDDLIAWTERTGHRSFAWSTPDGYPDVEGAWTGNMLDRWNFAIACVQGEIGGVHVPVADLTPEVVLNRPFNASERATLSADPSAGERLVTALTSPAFQYR
ncbi:MAG: DUF1800 domain-containing protein [Chloroflexota bacterium]